MGISQKFVNYAAMNTTTTAEVELQIERTATLTPRVRNAVLERDRNQCQRCGTSGENRLQLHHVTYRSHQGTHLEDNLVTLCATCHRAHHDGWFDVVLLPTARGSRAFFREHRR